MQKKISRHTRKKKIVNFVSDPRASTTPGTHALANNRRFPPFKTKERNQHASSVGIECLTIEFDQEQIFGTDETFFKIVLKSHVRVNRCVCVIYGITCRPCSTQLAFYFFHSSVDSTFVFNLNIFCLHLLIDSCRTGAVGRCKSALSTHQAVSGQK